MPVIITRMKPGINLIHLKFFCDAIAYESISEAARKNYISQSAVSQAITKLEIIFGTQLIFQTRQKLQVTEHGKIVFERAKKIFKEVQETFDLVDETKDEVSGSLKFIISRGLAMSLLAPCHEWLKENLPLVDFNFRMGGRNVIRAALKREEVDFAIVVYDDENFGQFEKQTLRKGVFNLYHSKEISPDTINQQIFVSNHDCLYVQDVKKYLEESAVESVNLTAVSGWDLVARFTELGHGVGFFPDYALSQNRYPHVSVHPFKIPQYEYEVCAIYNKGVKLPRATQSFLEQFKTY